MTNNTVEHDELRSSAAAFAEQYFGTHALDWDNGVEEFPDTERRRLGDMGYLGIALPEEHGGGGGTLTEALIVLEEVAKVSQTAAWPIFEANVGAARVIDLYGTDEQRARYLPEISSGRATMAVAISEPDAGSAATDMTLKVTANGNSLTLNGQKRWCSGAGHAELYLAYCRFSDDPGSRGIGAVVVERNERGLTFGPRENMMGFKGIHSADMFFDDVAVQPDSVVVGAGGFSRLFTAFTIERMGNATMSLAIAQRCLDDTVAYVQQRRQFGKPIGEFQLVQGSLAEMIVATESARLLVERAAAGAGRGAPDSLQASTAKYAANRAAKNVADLAVQLHGGYGYSTEYGIERRLRDAHGWAIAGGTTNMQQIRIVSEYLGQRFDQRR